MPKEKGAYVEEYPLAQADKEGTTNMPGKVMTGQDLELGPAPMMDNQPADRPLKGHDKVKADTEKFKHK